MGFFGNLFDFDGDGENLTWALDDEGTLTISGTGDMYDLLMKDHLGTVMITLNMLLLSQV